jgi:enoyl-CoA hydratase
MSDATLLLGERDGAVVTLTINRPDKLNALNQDLIDEIERRVVALSHEPGVRCAVLTGAGKAFVAGADIAAMATMASSAARAFSARGHALCALIEAAPFPFIAAVNGFALGGGLEIALACDFIYASDKAKLGLPEVTLGVIPGFGGTQRLATRVGVGRARELVYSGAIIAADEAVRIGLVNRVIAEDELLTEAKKTAARIAEVGPLAVGSAKRVMLHGVLPGLRAGCELESQAFAALFGSDDQRSGMKAFLDKTKAEFQGR